MPTHFKSRALEGDRQGCWCRTQYSCTLRRTTAPWATPVQRLLMNDLDTFYLNATEPNRGCLLALRAMVLAQDPLVTETRKYGMPCFCYRKKMFCYLWVDKRTDEPYLLFVEGKWLDHPALETGDRARMRILRVDPNADIPVDTVEALLKRALDLYRNGTIAIK